MKDHLVHALGEAVEVVDGVVDAGDGGDGGDGGVPVARNDENGPGNRVPLLLPRLQEVAGRDAVVDAQRRRSMRYEEGVHSFLLINEGDRRVFEGARARDEH